MLRYTPIVEWHLGPLSISPHGLGTAIGFLAGARLLLSTTRRLGIADPLVYAALTRGGIGAVIGARVAYVVNHLGSFDSPLEWVQIWNGGISLLGRRCTPEWKRTARRRVPVGSQPGAEP